MAFTSNQWPKHYQNPLFHFLHSSTKNSHEKFLTFSQANNEHTKSTQFYRDIFSDHASLLCFHIFKN